MKRIYVGNLAAGTDNRALEKLFQQYGHVSAAGVIRNQKSGESRGFGFVVMRNDRKGDEAIQRLNGSHLNGQCIHVLEALDPQAKPASSAHVIPLQHALDRFRRAG